MPPALTDTLFDLIGRGFSPEVYLAVTRIQGIFWSAADVTLIWFLLNITDLAGTAAGRDRAVRRRRLLVLSALLSPLLVFMPTARHFFLLESVIFGLQFSVLLFTLAADMRPVLDLLKKQVERRTRG